MYLLAMTRMLHFYYAVFYLRLYGLNNQIGFNTRILFQLSGLVNFGVKENLAKHSSIFKKFFK